MRKIDLIKNPELFQGEYYLDKFKNYFEGWYFKNTNGYDNIAFIPGISINKNKKSAFIQVITNNSSYYIDYDIDDFEFNDVPFYIRIKNNYFSCDNIHIDINDSKNNLIIKGEIGYYDSENISTSKYSPNIMGPFSYVPFMECNHAVISMINKTNGEININGMDINFDGGIGYIEKDYGVSFPSKYIWCQGNNFNDSDASFMMSIANIPFKIFRFRGLICSLIVDGCEYRFATYNNAKIVKFIVNDGLLDIGLKKGDYDLRIMTKYDDGFRLVAPVNGEMNKDIVESITADVKVRLKKKKKVIFSNVSKNCGLEIVSD